MLRCNLHHAVLKFSPYRNKTLPKLVCIANWYSIHSLLWVLQYPNSAVPSSSSLSLEQKSMGSITKTCCSCRRCYQRSTALLETCLSSSKTMRQHIMLVTQLSLVGLQWATSLQYRVIKRERRWNLLCCRKLANRSQPSVGRSSPYCGDIWRRYCCLMLLLRLSMCASVAKI